ncbi:MAG: hypothetical protein U5N86_08505 [Planctomycetota bacterium]|nr:hypothetical protein [Planctomycetota bacterium]
MYEALLKEFPENELVKREVQRGLEQFDEELKEPRLDALESDLRSAAKTGDPEKFSAASDELNELVPLIKARARESELEERAVAVSELRDELRTQMSSRLKEQEASELLKLATDAMEEDKYVLAKAILDNVVRKYSDTPAAAKAIQSLREVETKLEEIRAAMEEWTDVLARADELVLANKKEQAKTLVLDFLAKYPGFRPAKQYLETLN